MPVVTRSQSKSSASEVERNQEEKQAEIRNKIQIHKDTITSAVLEKTDLNPLSNKINSHLIYKLNFRDYEHRPVNANDIIDKLRIQLNELEYDDFITPEYLKKCYINYTIFSSMLPILIPKYQDNNNWNCYMFDLYGQTTMFECLFRTFAKYGELGKLTKLFITTARNVRKIITQFYEKFIEHLYKLKELTGKYFHTVEGKIEYNDKLVEEMRKNILYEKYKQDLNSDLKFRFKQNYDFELQWGYLGLDPLKIEYNEQLSDEVTRLNRDPNDFEPSYYYVYTLNGLNYCITVSSHPGISPHWKRPKMLPNGAKFVF